MLERASGEATIQGVNVTHDLGEAARLTRQATERMGALVLLTKDQEGV